MGRRYFAFYKSPLVAVIRHHTHIKRGYKRGYGMARTVQRLSPLKVKSAKAGMWCDGGGLYLQCTASADGKLRKSWIFRYAVKGREHQMGLGPLDAVGLAQAR